MLIHELKIIQTMLVGKIIIKPFSLQIKEHQFSIPELELSKPLIFLFFFHIINRLPCQRT